MRWAANSSSYISNRAFRLAMVMMAMGLSACTGSHSSHVSLDQQQHRRLQVIGLPQFTAAKKIDIRRENPIYAIIGISAKALQQVVREVKRTQYQNANPELLQQSLVEIRRGIKLRLRQQGYIVKDIPMTYWQAQAAYRRKDPALVNVDALLNVQIKRFGYFSGSPFKPYRPGVILTSDLVSTKDRNKLSSNVYNIGFDPEDLSKFELQIGYFTTIHVADKQYFYRNFDALMDHAKQSKKGLEFVAKVAAESVAGDLNKEVSYMNLASSRRESGSRR